jgi:uncharacterized protein with ParB-like and HNH nuclease domain
MTHGFYSYEGEQMLINVGAKNLFELFSGNSTVSVPSFQRNYSWTKDQLDQFLEDIFTNAAQETSHFWGPVVFLRLPDKYTNFEVIDGQQRITTAIILLSLLRDEAHKLQNRIVNPGTQGAYDVYSAIRNFLYLPLTYVDQRFTGSYLIENVLKNYVLADPDDGQGNNRPNLTVGGAGMPQSEKKNTRELRKAVLHMRQQLSSKLENFDIEDDRKVYMNKIFVSLTTNFEIHSMELGNEDDAYVLFETLNDRGLRLNPSDLLKTFTLREIRSLGTPTDMENALQKWDTTVANLGDNDFTKFLRHYMLTRTEDKVQSSKIFAHFKMQIRELDPQGAYKNLQLVSLGSIFYSNLLNVSQHSDNQLQASFVRMNSYSDTHRVFLLGMMQITTLDLQQQRLLARATERLSFRWISCGKNAQELETFYQKQVISLRQDPSSQNVTTVCETMIAASPSDQEMSNIALNDSIDLQKYILRRIEETTGGAVLAWSTPITLEHLAPQNPGANSAHWFGAVCAQDIPDSSGMNYDDYCGNWGNLTLLERALNSSIQNEVWPIKVAGQPASSYDGLSASTMNINQEITKCDHWTLAHIKDRAKWVTDAVLALTSDTWVRSGQCTVAKWQESAALKNLS